MRNVQAHPNTDRRISTRRQGGRAGRHLAKEIGARVTILTVSVPFHILTIDAQMIEDTAPQYNRRMEARAAKILKAGADVASAAGVACTTSHIEHEHPYRAIIETADAKGCDLIAMASHGRRGVSAIVLGSETVKILTHANTPC